MMKKELSDGVQTLQYQINTLMTTNGQTPFVTFALNFNPDGKYAKYGYGTYHNGSYMAKSYNSYSSYGSYDNNDGAYRDKNDNSIKQ